MPEVSIIIPNYNHARFLKQRLDSVFNQTYRDFEVILLDDSSTDNSIEILNEYAKHQKVSHFIINNANSGSPFKQWKKGIDLAKGKYIWIAESDDWADADFLHQLINSLFQDTAISLAFCRTNRVDEVGNSLGINAWGEYKLPCRWKNNYVNDGNDEIKNFLIHRNIIPNASAVLFRKEKALTAIDSVMHLRYCGDWLFWALIICNAKITYVSNPLNYYRRYEGATSLKQNRKVIIERVKEYSNVIARLKTMINILKSDLQFDHQWIIDEWFASREIVHPFNYLFLPLCFDFNKVFYKQLLHKLLHKLFTNK